VQRGCRNAADDMRKRVLRADLHTREASGFKELKRPAAGRALELAGINRGLQRQTFDITGSDTPVTNPRTLAKNAVARARYLASLIPTNGCSPSSSRSTQRHSADVVSYSYSGFCDHHDVTK